MWSQVPTAPESRVCIARCGCWPTAPRARHFILAREGGLESVLWAGPEHLARSVRSGRHPVQGTARSGPVSLQLGFASDDFSYLIDLGLPTRYEASAFNLDPEIKREVVWSGPIMRPASVLVKRKRALVELRGTSGKTDAWEPFESALRSYESVLTEC
jgi:predicted ATPase